METRGQQRTLGKTDIDIEFRPEDNRCSIVHEYSGLVFQTEDSHTLQTIRNLVLHHPDSSCLPSAKLHCRVVVIFVMFNDVSLMNTHLRIRVPASDVI